MYVLKLSRSITGLIELQRLLLSGVSSEKLANHTVSSGLALDYPPFFAYFEKLMSIPASFIDPKIVDLHNLQYDAWTVIIYQRMTVILSELVLGAALLR